MGGRIELDEPLALPDGQPVEVIVRPEALQDGDTGLPGEVLAAARNSPHLSDDDVSALASAIEAGRLPVRNAGAFDAGDA